MAKRSVSQKKSLKRLFFSKSTADLQESGAAEEHRTLSLFKRSEKKRKDKRLESQEASAANQRDAEAWPDPSVYATVPRSKKGLSSQSETDLRKPKRFPSFSLGWLKKKKNKDLSQSIPNISMEQDVKGQDSKLDNEVIVERSEVATPQPVPAEDPPINADQILHQGYESGGLKGEPDTASFIPANADIKSISYIDESDHDAYQTPPESPGLGSDVFFVPPDGTDSTDGADGTYQSPSNLPAEIVTPNLGTADALDANLENPITIPASKAVLESLESYDLFLRSVDPLPLEERSTLKHEDDTSTTANAISEYRMAEESDEGSNEVCSAAQPRCSLSNLDPGKNEDWAFIASGNVSVDPLSSPVLSELSPTTELSSFSGNYPKNNETSSNIPAIIATEIPNLGTTGDANLESPITISASEVVPEILESTNQILRSVDPFTLEERSTLKHEDDTSTTPERTIMPDAISDMAEESYEDSNEVCSAAQPRYSLSNLDLSHSEHTGNISDVPFSDNDYLKVNLHSISKPDAESFSGKNEDAGPDVSVDPLSSPVLPDLSPITELPGLSGNWHKNAETVTETPNLGNASALDANLESLITMPASSEAVPEFLGSSELFLASTLKHEDDASTMPKAISDMIEESCKGSNDVCSTGQPWYSLSKLDPSHSEQIQMDLDRFDVPFTGNNLHSISKSDAESFPGKNEDAGPDWASGDVSVDPLSSPVLPDLRPKTELSDFSVNWHKNYETYSNIPAKIITETPNLGNAGDANLEGPITIPASFEAVPEFPESTDLVLSSVDPFTLEEHSTLKHEDNASTTLDAVSDMAEESYEDSNEVCSTAQPWYSLSKLDPSHFEQVQIDHHSGHISDVPFSDYLKVDLHSVSKADAESFPCRNEDAGPDWSSGDVSDDPTTELSGLSGNWHKNDKTYSNMPAKIVMETTILGNEVTLGADLESPITLPASSEAAPEIPEISDPILRSVDPLPLEKLSRLPDVTETIGNFEDHTTPVSISSEGSLKLPSTQTEFYSSSFMTSDQSVLGIFKHESSDIGATYVSDNLDPNPFGFVRVDHEKPIISSPPSDGFSKYTLKTSPPETISAVSGMYKDQNANLYDLKSNKVEGSGGCATSESEFHELFDAVWAKETLGDRLRLEQEWKAEENVLDKYIHGVEERVFTNLEQQRDEQGFDKEREAIGGKVVRQLPDLALKPDAPVRQAFVSEECAPASPCSLRGEVTLAGRSQEIHPHLHLGAGSRHALQDQSEIRAQHDPAGGGADDSVVRLHVEEADVHTHEPVPKTCRDNTGEEIRPDPEDREYTLQNTPENLHTPESDTSITSSGRTSSAGIIVYVRHFNLDQSSIETNRTRASPDTKCLPESGSSPDWIPHAALTTLNEFSEAESPVESPLVSDTDMSSGLTSTTFTLRPRMSQEGQNGKKVHKVSLVSSSSSTNSPELYTDENRLRTEPNGHGLDDWRPWHEDYLSIREDSGSSEVDGSESGSTYLSSSFSRYKYEPNDYSYLSSSAEREWESPPSFSSFSQGSSNVWRESREVQEGTESGEGRRSWAELAEPVGGRELERDAVFTNEGFDSRSDTDETDGFLAGVFTATRVDLLPSPTDSDPEPLAATSPHEIDTLLDRLKSMAPPVRHRSVRNTSSLPFSSLPPIVEDAPIPAPVPSPTFPKPLVSLPPDLGLNWAVSKDMRSPLAMLKEQQGLDSAASSRSIALPSRTSAISSLVMRKSSLPNHSSEDGTHLNGILSSSRLDNSILFSNYRLNQTEENGKVPGHRPVYRAASLPDVSSTQDFLSSFSRGSHTLTPASSSYELSYLTSSANSLPEEAKMSRISRSSLVIHSPPPESPTSNHAPSISSDYNSIPPESQPPSLQRRLSAGSSNAYNDVGGHFGTTYEPGLERNFVVKYRAFPDAYRTKEKEHGKLNPRPGKLFIYTRPGRQGQRIEVRGDVVDATQWEFPEERISIRVVRGGWVLYEKPDFKGEKIALDEGDVELTYPFRPQEDKLMNPQNSDLEPGENRTIPEPRHFIIGSLRRAVRDYSVPEICLFPEENAEGKKVVFRDTSEDSRIYGFPIKSNSIIVNAGVWLVFADPFFQGVPRVLEVGGFTNPAAWGVTHPYVSSLHPLKIGEPTVERPNEPKLIIYEKPYFTGKSREIYTNMKDFINSSDRQQKVFMYSAASMKVIGGIWVGYEKEGFRGHQYLLEEGEYHDWRSWGGCDSELRSVRVIRTDLSQPLLVMIEMTNEHEEVPEDEERTLEVTEAIPDLELVEFQPCIRSVQVLSGAWVAYSHVDYSGNQYILEKGFYNNCADWGSIDNRICSIQPILPALTDNFGFRSELLLYSEPSFQGTCQMHCEGEGFLPERHTVQSCRVVGGSWVLYDDTGFGGNQYILSEGDYTNLSSMGCPETCILRSVKPIPTMFTIPSISLFGLECFEGREVEVEGEVSNMMEGGFNPHFLSVRVNSGCWVLCEHSNYRGRQFLLEPMEITNWPKFSSITSIGSVYPVRMKRRLFRIRYTPTGLYMSVQGGVDSMKTGRVVVSEQVEGQSDVWLYEDGLIKNKLVQNMSLQVVGGVEPGAKVVLWSETRSPVQTWSAQLSGPIGSLTYPGLVLDVKGGKTYDKEHVIVRAEGEEDATPLWDIELI